MNDPEPEFDWEAWQIDYDADQWMEEQEWTKWWNKEITNDNQDE